MIYLENKTKQTIRPRRKLEDVEISNMEYILIVWGESSGRRGRLAGKGEGNLSRLFSYPSNGSGASRQCETGEVVRW